MRTMLRVLMVALLVVALAPLQAVAETVAVRGSGGLVYPINPARDGYAVVRSVRASCPGTQSGGFAELRIGSPRNRYVLVPGGIDNADVAPGTRVLDWSIPGGGGVAGAKGQTVFVYVMACAGDTVDLEATFDRIP